MDKELKYHPEGNFLCVAHTPKGTLAKHIQCAKCWEGQAETCHHGSKASRLDGSSWCVCGQGPAWYVMPEATLGKEWPS